MLWKSQGLILETKCCDRGPIPHDGRVTEHREAKVHSTQSFLIKNIVHKAFIGHRPSETAKICAPTHSFNDSLIKSSPPIDSQIDGRIGSVRIFLKMECL